MRTYLLVSFGLACLGNALMAQSPLPASIRPHLAQWPAELVRTLELAGSSPAETRKATPGAVPKTGFGFTGERLDSTVTYFAYPVTANDSIPLQKEVYTYPDEATERLLSLSFNGGEWVPDDRTQINRDEAGRVRLVTGETFNPETGGWIPESRLESFPHGDSDVATDSFFLYQYSPELQEFQQVLAVRSFYDEKGLPQDQYSTLIFFEEPLTFHDVYSYNQFDQVNYIRTYLVLPEEEEEFLIGETDRFHENDVLIRVTYYNIDELGQLSPSDLETYTYNGFNRTATRADFTYDSKDMDWILLDSIFYGYDAQLRQVSEETRFYEEDQLTSISRLDTEYALEETVSVITNSTYDFGEAAFLIDDRTFYYYGISTPVFEPRPQTSQLNAYPNPTTGILNLDLNEIALAQVFDLTGRLVLQTTPLAANQAIDLSALPTGVYALRVLAGRQTYTGRVVKG